MADARKEAANLGAVAYQNIERFISAIPSDVGHSQAHRHRFTLPVVSASSDGSVAKVRLCTGGTLDVPMSAVTNGLLLGHVTIGDERFAIASAEIDTTTASGGLLQQTAHELVKASRALQALRANIAPSDVPDDTVPSVAAKVPPTLEIGSAAPADIPQAPTTVKIPFWGTAGEPQLIQYRPTDLYYIYNTGLNFMTFTAEFVTFINCFMEPTNTSSRFIFENSPSNPLNLILVGLDYFVDAQHGTPLGKSYYATLELQLTLVQETT